MPYPEDLVAPMRQELVSNGFTELRNAADVQQAMNNEVKTGTTLLVINSVCGCAAGTARPGVVRSLQASAARPDHLMTVFAGQDLEATQEARKHTFPYPPSSPSIALYKDGKLVHFIERHHIEGRSADMIAQNLNAAYAEHCAQEA